MSTIATQMRIDADLKLQAAELFSRLGLDMTGAVTLFLKQCILRGGLPFPVELPNYRKEVIEAAAEARQISKDPAARRYKNFSEVIAELDDEV